MRQGGDSRGSSYDRKARKIWMLRTFGDGQKCRCTHCRSVLTLATLEADRIVPGSRGGTYKRGNIQPACRSCNASRADNVNWVAPVARAA